MKKLLNWDVIVYGGVVLLLGVLAACTTIGLFSKVGITINGVSY